MTSERTNTRTDVHRPATLVTEDYEYVGCYDLGDSETPPTFYVPTGLNYIGEYGFGRCDHCGASLRYGAVLVHTPSGPRAAISVGETCLGNRFERATSDFHATRKAAQLDRERQRIRAAWEDYRAQHADVDWDALSASTNDFVCDVLAKGRRYGQLSERQLETVVAAVARDIERAAGRPEEIKVPAPEGRISFTGEIVSVKEHDGYMGGIDWKMTVKVSTPDGIWLAWVTVPRNLAPRNLAYTALRGSTVALTATLTPSDRDPSFAFGKRPTKAEILQEVSA